ncbi:MAG: hypothetical protein WCG01_02150 [bacterium]
MSFSFVVERQGGDVDEKELEIYGDIEMAINKANENDGSRILHDGKLLAIAPIIITDKDWRELIIKWHYSYKIVYDGKYMLRLIENGLMKKKKVDAKYCELARRLFPVDDYLLYDFFGQLVDQASIAEDLDNPPVSNTEANSYLPVSPFVVFKLYGGPWPGISCLDRAKQIANEPGARVVDSGGVTVYTFKE